MTPRRGAIVPLLLGLGATLGVAAAPASGAAGPKVVGTLTGLPAGATAAVATVDPNTLRVLAAARVKGKGRYRLRAEPRLTMLYGNGDASLFAASPAFRPTGRTRIDLALAPTTGLPAAEPAPSPGAVTAAPAVTVDHGISGSLGNGTARIAPLVESGVVRAGIRRCDLRVVTSDPSLRRAVEDEVARQQAGGADPSIAITFDPTPPSVRIQGGGTESGSRHTVSLQAIDLANGAVVAESSSSNANPLAAVDRASRDMARRLCDVLHPTGSPGDPYLVVVEGTHSAQFVYRTPDVEDPMCDSRDEADGSQGFSFASEPALATVAFRNGLSVVSIDPAAVLFTGTRTASYRFFRDGPACFPPTPVDTSGCGVPQDPLGRADFAFTQKKIQVTLAFPDYAGCPFTPLIDANSAVGETTFDAKRLDPGGPTVFRFQARQDEDEGDVGTGLVNRAGAVTSWTVTFTPAD